ncbi:MAG: AsmA family protein, partial [Burkholderiaceae bacterium]|nr:AsmA family protein [Burkholderiaceae bacterium]
NSVSAMLASSNGEFAANASEGSVSKYILELAGLNVANAVFVKVFGDKQIHMNCLISDFSVKRGDANVRRFVLDSDDATVEVNGDIDMAQERLNLDVHPKTKGLRIISLRTPLYAKGTFSHPDVGPYKGPLILKGAAAAALAAIAPPAAVLPLVNPGNTPAVNCASLLAESNKVRAAPKSEPTRAPAPPVTDKQVQKARQQK